MLEDLLLGHLGCARRRQRPGSIVAVDLLLDLKASLDAPFADDQKLACGGMSAVRRSTPYQASLARSLLSTPESCDLYTVLDSRVISCFFRCGYIWHLLVMMQRRAQSPDCGLLTGLQGAIAASLA